jgi:monoamine oxidase
MSDLVAEAEPRSMEDLLRVLLADIQVEAVFGHDWSRDPFSRGTWLAVCPGQHRPVAVLRDWKGRVLFAGADLDTGWAGWMDGAITSGKRAAAELGRQIGSGK